MVSISCVLAWRQRRMGQKKKRNPDTGRATLLNLKAKGRSDRGQRRRMLLSVDVIVAWCSVFGFFSVS